MKLTSLAAGFALAALPITTAAVLAQAPETPQAPEGQDAPAPGATQQPDAGLAQPEAREQGAQALPAAQDEPAPITDPQQFADAAASSNMFEIQSSQIALDVSQNPDVVAFAEQMVADHTAAGERMMAAAEADGILPASALEDLHQEQLDELAGLEGDAFDEAYIAAQLAAHRAAVGLFQSFSADGEESNLKTFATETLPTLEQHLEHITMLAEGAR